MDNSIVVVQQEIAPLIAQSMAVTIASQEDLVSATEILSAMNRVMDRVEEEKNKVLRPILDAAQAERARWKPVETQYKAAIEPLRNKISIYQTETMRAAAAAQEKLAKDVAKGKISIDDASQALSNNVVAERVNTQLGNLTFRESQILKITNEKLVPEKYWIIDEETLLNDLKEGKKVKGAEIEVVMIPVNRR